MAYSIAFKANMVKRMTARRPVSATALAEETGVSQATLSRWKSEASSVRPVTNDNTPKRTQDWTPEEKLRAVLETSGLDGTKFGAYLRSHGLHSEQLETWRKDALAGLGGGGHTKGKRTAERRQIRLLEREVRRKDKALAETAALLVLKKKFNGLFADEDDDTSGTSGE